MSSVAQLVRERFGELTPIQKLAIPKVLSGEHVLILAPTGFGKTESALLPVLEKVKGQEKGICALYITPLRALSRDLKMRFDWWCERLQISHNVRSGDTSAHERTKMRKDPPKILLTTVESVQALMLGKVMRSHLRNIRFVIVDEIHDVLDNKRGAQLSFALERLNQLADFQRIGLSATVANESEAARLLFGERPYSVCEAGRNRKMEISMEKADRERLKELVDENRSLVFVNTRSTAEELGASLKKMGASLEVHHGSLAKEVRQSAEDNFKAGTINSLLCTSSLELGIDVGDVSLVIQHGSPHQVSRLIQRIGRSGHSMTKTPKGVVFYNDFDDRLESEVIASLAENGWMEDKKVERGALDVIANQLVGLCLENGRMLLADAHSVLSRSYAYGINYEKLRTVALQLYSEGLLFYDERDRDVWIKPTRRARDYFVKFLSTIPKTKRFAMRDVSSNRIISSLDEEFVVNLESGSSFFSKGLPWCVVDITEEEVLAQPSSASDIAVPSWTGEDIPVSFEVAQQVGKMRKARKDVKPLPDDQTVIIEVIEDIVIVHCCFGTQVNGALARLFSLKLSRLLRESVRAVSDPYRILVKLPFPVKEEYLLRAFNDIRGVRNQLEEALSHSSLLRFKFLHVGRLFGLLSEDATVGSRFIDALRYSVVYEEAVRSVFFRYFDVLHTEKIISDIRKGNIRVVVDSREKPSFFARIGIERFSAGESIGAFEPRAMMVDGFRQNALSRTLHLVCLNCAATRFLHLAGAKDSVSCHKCGHKSLTIADRSGKPLREAQYMANLIRNYGKRALIALSTYGVGPSAADRILKKLHPDDASFYLDIIEAQKLFIKNKKYWKLS